MHQQPPFNRTLRFTHDWLVDRRLRAHQDKNHNVYNFLFNHNTAHLAPLSIVLAPISTPDGTRGRAAVEQVNASFFKGVHPYKAMIPNKPKASQ